MARVTVKNLKEVQDLSNAILNNVDLLDSQFSNAADAVTDMAAELEKSANYSKQNLDNAKQVANMGKRSLDAAAKGGILGRAQLGINKFILSDLGKRLGIQKNLTEDQQIKLMLINDEIESQIKSNNIASKLNGKLKEGVNSIKGKVAAALSLSAIFGTLTAIATSFASRIDDVGKSFGVLAADKEFINNITAAELEVAGLGRGTEDVISTVQGLTSNFGLTLDRANELAPSIIKSGIALGISNDEAVNLFGTLTEVLGLGEDAAIAFNESTFALAKQARVAPTAVFRDIVGSADAVAKFTSATGDNIAEAAIQAQRLGIGLDTSAKIAESLLDFQSSIQAELEASALIGRRLDFQRARELALTNDVAGAVQAVVAQLGSEEELNNLNSIQREAIAKSIGVSNAELAKVVGKQKELNSLADVFASGPSIVETLKADDSLSNLTKIVAEVKKLGVAVINALGPDIETFVGELLVKLKEITQEGGLMQKLQTFAKSIGEAFVAMADNLKVVAMVATGLATALTVAAIASTAATAGGNLLAAAAVAGVSVAALTGMLAFHDLKEGTMAVATAQDSPVNMTRGEAVARVEDIQQKEVHVHVDNSEVVEAINNINFEVDIDRNKLQVLLNGGAGI